MTPPPTPQSRTMFFALLPPSEVGRGETITSPNGMEGPGRTAPQHNTKRVVSSRLRALKLWLPHHQVLRLAASRCNVVRGNEMRRSWRTRSREGQDQRKTAPKIHQTRYAVTFVHAGPAPARSPWRRSRGEGTREAGRHANRTFHVDGVRLSVSRQQLVILTRDID